MPPTQKLQSKQLPDYMAIHLTGFNFIICMLLDEGYFQLFY